MRGVVVDGVVTDGVLSLAPTAGEVTHRLVESLRGTGPVFAELAAFALVAIALGAGARAAMLWMQVHHDARATRRVAATGAAPVAAPVPTTAAELTQAAYAVYAAQAQAAPMRQAATRAPATSPRAVVAAPGRAAPAGVPPRLHDATQTPSLPHRSAALVAGFTQALLGRMGRRAQPGLRMGARRTRRPTPAHVRQLADAGAPRAEIARRTGLSQDAVGLALHLGTRQV
jgi:hypothetical protein